MIGVLLDLLRRYRAPVVLLSSFLGCACGIYTLDEKRDLFHQYYIQDSIGHTIAELTRYEHAGIGQRSPTEIRQLANGNELYVYDGLFDYRSDNGSCSLMLEVESESTVVVDGYSKGRGCYVVP